MLHVTSPSNGTQTLKLSHCTQTLKPRLRAAASAALGKDNWRLRGGARLAGAEAALVHDGQVGGDHGVLQREALGAAAAKRHGRQHDGAASERELFSE